MTVEVSRDMAVALANQICGCATIKQHRADVDAVLSYASTITAPLLAENAAQAERIKALEREVERLTDALQQIAGYKPRTIATMGIFIARAALGGAGHE